MHAGSRDDAEAQLRIALRDREQELEVAPRIHAHGEDVGIRLGLDGPEDVHVDTERNEDDQRASGRQPIPQPARLVLAVGDDGGRLSEGCGRGCCIRSPRSCSSLSGSPIET